MSLRVLSHQEYAVRAYNKKFIVAKIMCRLCLANHLLEFIFIIFLVHVLDRLHVGGDISRNDSIELVSSVLMTCKHHIQQFTLVTADHRLHDLTRVLMNINKEASQMIQRDGLMVSVHDRINLKTIHNVTIVRQMNTKVLHLDDAFFFFVVHLSLKVQIACVVKVQDIHLSLGLFLRKLQAALFRCIVNDCSEETSFNALSCTKFLIEKSNQIFSKWDPFRNQKLHIIQDDGFGEFITNRRDTCCGFTGTSTIVGERTTTHRAHTVRKIGR
mmetsp:Transcript_4867/g.14861  ORF Transcript_4867/g.14861 Transcript_4867/m.14861 type:complete len:271 (-) Transcript_4867:670-1482(-)